MTMKSKRKKLTDAARLAMIRMQIESLGRWMPFTEIGKAQIESYKECLEVVKYWINRKTL